MFEVVPYDRRATRRSGLGVPAVGFAILVARAFRRSVTRGTVVATSGLQRNRSPQPRALRTVVVQGREN